MLSLVNDNHGVIPANFAHSFIGQISIPPFSFRLATIDIEASGRNQFCSIEIGAGAPEAQIIGIEAIHDLAKLGERLLSYRAGAAINAPCFQESDNRRAFIGGAAVERQLMLL